MKTRLQLLDEKCQLAGKLASGVHGEVYKGILRQYYKVLDDLKKKNHVLVVKK